jgi:hypothetical protein
MVRTVAKLTCYYACRVKSNMKPRERPWQALYLRKKSGALVQ